MLSFYDWYADLPVASPAGVRRPDRRARVRRLVGRRLPDHVGLERPGHPHAGRALDGRGPLPRARRSSWCRPDYADNVKFADEWLRRRSPGTDGALAMAMGHVVLKEFFVDRQVPLLRRLRASATPTCRSWSRSSRATAARYRAGQVPHRRRPRATTERERGVQDGARRRGDRRAGRAERLARLPVRRGRRGPVEPRPRRRRPAADRCSAATASAVAVDAAALRHRRRRGRGRCAAACRSAQVGGQLVTTVYDLLLAQYGVGRAGPARATGRPATTTPSQPYTPAWQEQITGVPAAAAARIGREFAAQRRGVRRPLDDHHGRRARTTGSTPTRSTARSCADHADRLPGRQRRRLGALRRAGEGAARSPAGRTLAFGARLGRARRGR